MPSREEPIKSKRVFSNDNDKMGYVLIAPFYIFLLTFVIIPIIVNILLSFTDYDLTSLTFVGVKNYFNLFVDPFFLISIKNTAIYAAFTLIFTMLLGLMIALALNKKIYGLWFYRTSFFIPHVTSMVAMSMMWLWIYDPSEGILNKLLSVFGIVGKQWLFDPKLALGSIIFMSILKFIGYNMIVFLAGLQSIPNYLYEAAVVDGANSMQKFMHITFPMLKPITFFLFVTGLINNFNVFEQVNVLTGGGPSNSTTTMVHQIYFRAFQDFHLGYAAAEAVILLIIVVFITFFNFKFGNQGSDLDIG
jgi:ABC-type sugar transport system permease subunit